MTVSASSDANGAANRDFTFTLSGLAGLDLRYLQLVAPNAQAANSVYFIDKPFSLGVDSGDVGTIVLQDAKIDLTARIAQNYLYLTGLEVDDAFTFGFTGRNGSHEYTFIGYALKDPSATAPEPATMLMFGLGIAGVAVARRIRRK